MKRLAACTLAALLLAGCAHPWNAVGLAPGTPREEVLARAGQPQRVFPLAGGGQRLQYSSQPFAQANFNVDFDAAGRLVQAQQVLNARNFERIRTDVWTRDDIDREFGPPARIDGVSSWHGPIYTYRWKDHGDMLYWVYFDPQGVVRRHHPGIEHVNAPDDAPAARP